MVTRSNPATRARSTHEIFLDVESGSLGSLHRNPSVLVALICLCIPETGSYMPIQASLAMVPPENPKHTTFFEIPLTLPAGCSLEDLHCIILHQCMRPVWVCGGIPCANKDYGRLK